MMGFVRNLSVSINILLHKSNIYSWENFKLLGHLEMVIAPHLLFKLWILLRNQFLSTNWHVVEIRLIHFEYSQHVYLPSSINMIIQDTMVNAIQFSIAFSRPDASRPFRWTFTRNDLQELVKWANRQKRDAGGILKKVVKTNEILVKVSPSH